MNRWTRARLGSLAVAAVLALVGTTAVAAAAPGAHERPGRTQLVSVGVNGEPAKYPASVSGCNSRGDISADGRYMVFESNGTNLISAARTDPTRCDLFWRDLKARVTKLVNVASDGAQVINGLGTDSVAAPSISADGRFVAFRSAAINLVPGDTNNADDVFVHDTRGGRTVRVSVPNGGGQANGSSGQPSISGNGRYVAFSSRATNLVPGDTNGLRDVFVRDLKTGKTVRASLSSRGAQARGDSGSALTISANGRFLAFNSSADNLVRGDTTNELCRCNAPDVFRRDMKTGTTLRISVASDGTQASFAAFPSCVVGGAPPLEVETPVVPLRLGGGVEICYNSLHLNSAGGHQISDDGRYVTFLSNATNLVPNDTNQSNTGVYNGNMYAPVGVDAFVHDVVTRRTERVSVTSSGQEYKWGGFNSAIGGNGRYVSFTTYLEDQQCIIAPPLVGAGNPVVCAAWNAFAYDRGTGQRDRLSVSTSGGDPTPGHCSFFDASINGSQGSSTRTAGISRNGRWVAMYSPAKNLVPGDSNDRCDYFVRDRGTSLGVGGFGGGGDGPGQGQDEVCLADGVCLPPLSTVDAAGEARAPLVAQAADLIGARVVPRAGLRDLFVRLDLARMPEVSGSPTGGLLYGLEFTAGGQRYEVRVQRVPGADFDAKGGASFGLFRLDATTGLWAKVAALKGGYGTTGPSVVAAVPVKELGGAPGGRLSDVRAFTGVGSYLTGVTKVLDAVRLAR